MEFLTWLENTSFATWERESLSLMVYPFFLTLHTFGMAFLVGMNAALDLRLLGVAPRLPLPPMEKLFRFMWLGFWVNLVTGLMLLQAYAILYLTMPDFYIKLGAVALGMVTLRLIQREVFGSNPASQTSVSPKAKTLAVASLAFWSVTIVAGKIMEYPAFVQREAAGAFIVIMVVMLLAGFVGAKLRQAV